MAILLQWLMVRKIYSEARRSASGRPSEPTSISACTESPAFSGLTGTPSEASAVRGTFGFDHARSRLLFDALERIEGDEGSAAVVAPDQRHAGAIARGAAGRVRAPA